jgi:Fe-S-cluster-containing dehydrogenase component
MDTNRRGFLRHSLTILGAAATSSAAYKAVAATDTTMPNMANPAQGASTPARTPADATAGARQGVPGRKWVMVIDLAKCDGCGKCITACSKMHFVPPDRQWIKVLRMQESEKTAPYFFPQPCYHCDNPPCTKVCPVDATFKRSDGVVLIDNERCIGCRFCMAACPYGARSFNWGEPENPPAAFLRPYSPEQGFPRRIGTVEKCDFCPDMAEKGMLPACTASCPMNAIYYGDENEDAVTNSSGETVRLSQLLLDRSGYRHMEELGTKPRVYYLPPKNRMFAPPPTIKD